MSSKARMSNGIMNKSKKSIFTMRNTAKKMNNHKKSIFSMRNTAKKMNNHKESIFTVRNVVKNMNKRKESIFIPQNDAPQHTSHKANDIRFQKSSVASTDKNENNFFPGKGLHLFIGSANMLFIGLLLVVQAKPELIRDDVHIIWC